MSVKSVIHHCSSTRACVHAIHKLLVSLVSEIVCVEEQ
jgi:hypothetical protein